MNQILELHPMYDNRKSFYGKAHVIYDYDNNYVTLRSYNTDVCRIEKGVHGWKFRKLWNGYSATTMRHILDFLYQFGTREYFNKVGGKQWWKSLECK